ncbi:unnamed protein product [Effrenium voratum]|nr:unnamed protein product [Effrenium voratum]
MTGRVIEDMERLQSESWAAGVLAEILEEEKRALRLRAGPPARVGGLDAEACHQDELVVQK